VLYHYATRFRWGQSIQSEPPPIVAPEFVQSSESQTSQCQTTSWTIMYSGILSGSLRLNAHGNANPIPQSFATISEVVIYEVPTNPRNPGGGVHWSLGQGSKFSALVHLSSMDHFHFSSGYFHSFPNSFHLWVLNWGGVLEIIYSPVSSPFLSLLFIFVSTITIPGSYSYCHSSRSSLMS